MVNGGGNWAKDEFALGQIKVKSGCCHLWPMRIVLFQANHFFEYGLLKKSLLFDGFREEDRPSFFA